MTCRFEAARANVAYSALPRSGVSAIPSGQQNQAAGTRPHFIAKVELPPPTPQGSAEKYMGGPRRQGGQGGPGRLSAGEGVCTFLPIISK